MTSRSQRRVALLLASLALPASLSAQRRPPTPPGGVKVAHSATQEAAMQEAAMQEAPMQEAAMQERAVREAPAARACVDATGVTGAVLIADARTGALVAGHAERVDRPLIPASTFKIVSALVALETGVIADAQTVIPWDSVTRDRPEINRDLDLLTAFRLSAVPHFQSLVRQIGAERMQHALDTIGYGNRDLRGGIDQFWLTGALRITPRQQIALLGRLLRDDLPVSRRSMAMVRDMMRTDSTAAYTIRAKTGLATPPGSGTVGWWVGWVEHGADVHLFATALETTTPPADFAAQRLAVTRCALQGLSILPVGPQRLQAHGRWPTAHGAQPRAPLF